MAKGSSEGIKEEPRDSSIKKEKGPPPSEILARPSQSKAPSRTSQASSPRRSPRGDPVENKDGYQENEKQRRGRSSSRKREARDRSRHRSRSRKYEFQLPTIKRHSDWRNRWEHVSNQRDRCVDQINSQWKEIKKRDIDLERCFETLEDLREQFGTLKEHYATRGTMLDQWKQNNDSLKFQVDDSLSKERHLSETIRELQAEKKRQDEEVQALKDSVKNEEGTDAAEQVQLLTKEKEDLQTQVQKLQAEKAELLESVRHSHDKFQAEKAVNITLRGRVKRFEEKYGAEEREDDHIRDQRPPLKRPKHASNPRESEGEKADKSRKKQPRSRSPSRRNSASRTQEADNTSDGNRRDRFRDLVGCEPEAEWTGCG